MVPEELEPYFQDVHDHVAKATRAIEGFRELLTSVLAANLTQITGLAGGSFDLRTTKFPIDDQAKGTIPTGGNAIPLAAERTG